MPITQRVLSYTDVEVAFVRIEVAIRYGTEDIPDDFPLRDRDMWRATVDIETGQIQDWPAGQSGDLHMKVCDESVYRLLDIERRELAAIENNYVPHGLVPGSYGDYIELEIDAKGVITNWPESPNIQEFFPED